MFLGHLVGGKIFEEFARETNLKKKFSVVPPLPVFGRSVNPISTGVHIVPTTLVRAPPDFQTLRQEGKGQ